MKHAVRLAVDLPRAGLVVLAGSGGVGKTTTSAALALAYALQGKRVLVLTIDPARRLLQALGLPTDDGPDQRLEPNVAHEVLPRLRHLLPDPPEAGNGSLHAMMLDPSSGAIAMVERLLPDPSRRDEVIHNRIYKAFLPTLQASPDYMALELLCELHQRGQYDVLVLDTPPMHNALDFLRAGHTLASFINDRVLKWFAKVPMPGKKAGGLSGLLGTGGSVAMSVLGRLFGAETLPDVAQFFVAFQEVLPRLRDRALATDALLRADDTHFVVVTAPGETSLREARHLHHVLHNHGIGTTGFVVNRVLHLPDELRAPADEAQLRAALLEGGTPDADASAWAAQLHLAADRLRHLAHADAQHLKALRQLAGPGGLCVAVPQREGDLHHVAQLAELGQLVLGAAAAPVVH
ncbi:MAG: AAA family ATPase [Deltaproteobacteria bacterium]|nr:AAA family ATPase [Deltaproteobacteria bacterium]